MASPTAIHIEACGLVVIGIGNGIHIVVCGLVFVGFASGYSDLHTFSDLYIEALQASAFTIADPLALPTAIHIEACGLVVIGIGNGTHVVVCGLVFVGFANGYPH